MTETAVTTEVHQSLERSLKLSAKIALYFLSALNDLSNFIYLLFSQIVRANALFDTCLS
jgi:hypothetical protein